VVWRFYPSDFIRWRVPGRSCRQPRLWRDDVVYACAASRGRLPGRERLGCRPHGRALCQEVAAIRTPVEKIHFDQQILPSINLLSIFFAQ
jgi:hypothetical protein